MIRRNENDAAAEPKTLPVAVLAVNVESRDRQRSPVFAVDRPADAGVAWPCLA